MIPSLNIPQSLSDRNEPEFRADTATAVIKRHGFMKQPYTHLPHDYDCACCSAAPLYDAEPYPRTGSNVYDERTKGRGFNTGLQTGIGYQPMGGVNSPRSATSTGKLGSVSLSTTPRSGAFTPRGAGAGGFTPRGVPLTIEDGRGSSALAISGGGGSSSGSANNNLTKAAELRKMRDAVNPTKPANLAALRAEAVRDARLVRGTPCAITLVVHLTMLDALKDNTSSSNSNTNNNNTYTNATTRAWNTTTPRRSTTPRTSTSTRRPVSPRAGSKSAGSSPIANGYGGKPSGRTTTPHFAAQTVSSETRRSGSRGVSRGASASPRGSKTPPRDEALSNGTTTTINPVEQPISVLVRCGRYEGQTSLSSRAHHRVGNSVTWEERFVLPLPMDAAAAAMKKGGAVSSSSTRYQHPPLEVYVLHGRGVTNETTAGACLGGALIENEALHNEERGLREQVPVRYLPDVVAAAQAGIGTGGGPSALVTAARAQAAASDGVSSDVRADQRGSTSVASVSQQQPVEPYTSAGLTSNVPFESIQQIQALLPSRGYVETSWHVADAPANFTPVAMAVERPRKS